MAIDRGHRFGIDFDDAFPQGLVTMGEVSPDNEYQSREDRAANRPVRQRVDEVTGKRQWKVMVTDPAETRAKRASFEINLLADVQPVPTTSEALPGMRPIELDCRTARRWSGRVQVPVVRLPRDRVQAGREHGVSVRWGR
jgi:hypothetical protein